MNHSRPRLATSAGTQVPDVQQFLTHYNMQCPMAAKRLIQSGMPATQEHGKPRYSSSSMSSCSLPVLSIKQAMRFRSLHSYGTLGLPLWLMPLRCVVQDIAWVAFCCQHS